MKDQFVLLVWPKCARYISPAVFGPFDNRGRAEQELIALRRRLNDTHETRVVRMFSADSLATQQQLTSLLS